MTRWMYTVPLLTGKSPADLHLLQSGLPWMNAENSSMLIHPISIDCWQNFWQQKNL
jgi:hypothetical protein